MPSPGEPELTERARRLVEAVRARGSDAQDPRDAAHEAAHALKWAVKGKWTRKKLDRASPKIRGVRLVDELEARAVEQIVSAAVGYDCGTVEHWAGVMWLEAFKIDHVSYPLEDRWLEKRIAEYMERPATMAMAQRVLELIQ